MKSRPSTSDIITGIRRLPKLRSDSETMARFTASGRVLKCLLLFSYRGLR